MSAVTQLGYLGISVKDLDSWRGYATSMLGLEEAGRDPDGTMLLGMDGHHNRFQFRGDGADDLAHIGWETDSAASLAEIAARLEGAGVAVRQGTKELAERRHVSDLVAFNDPDGNAVELFRGPETVDRGETRFHADDLGLGHLVLFVQDLERTMDFYTGLLGFRVSDYVNAGRNKLGFLHCNPRHHSIAFGQFPAAKQRIHHFMLQTKEIDPVGCAYDEANTGAAPLVTTLGRHSNDEMVSFYMRNPSGFAVEYGWGAREIDDSCWTVQEYARGTIWGHKPVTDSIPAK
ncbi:MAG: VOC family protein [Dehalococcoidia bacterium]